MHCCALQDEPLESGRKRGSRSPSYYCWGLHALYFRQPTSFSFGLQPRIQVVQVMSDAFFFHYLHTTYHLMDSTNLLLHLLSTVPIVHMAQVVTRSISRTPIIAAPSSPKPKPNHPNHPKPQNPH